MLALMRLRRLTLATATAGLLLAAGTAALPPTHAQESEAEEAAPTEPAARPGNAPYLRPMSRLATILGSMHFLRKLCGDEEAGVWRDEMNTLLEALAPNDADRRHLVASFNSGYRAFEATYRSCTDAARVAANRYREEGATLAREISSRYGA